MRRASIDRISMIEDQPNFWRKIFNCLRRFNWIWYKVYNCSKKENDNDRDDQSNNFNINLLSLFFIFSYLLQGNFIAIPARRTRNSQHLRYLISASIFILLRSLSWFRSKFDSLHWEASQLRHHQNGMLTL